MEPRKDVPTPGWKKIDRAELLRRLEATPAHADPQDEEDDDDTDETFVKRHARMASRERADWLGGDKKKKSLYPPPAVCAELHTRALKRARNYASGKPSAVTATAPVHALAGVLQPLRVISTLERQLRRARQALAAERPLGELGAEVRKWADEHVDAMDDVLRKATVEAHVAYGSMLAQVAWVPPPATASMRELVAVAEKAEGADVIEVADVDEQTEIYQDFFRDELRQAGFTEAADSFKLKYGYRLDGAGGNVVYDETRKTPLKRFTVGEEGLCVDRRWLTAPDGTLRPPSNRMPTSEAAASAILLADTARSSARQLRRVKQEDTPTLMREVVHHDLTTHARRRSAAKSAGVRHAQPNGMHLASKYARR